MRCWYLTGLCILAFSTQLLTVGCADLSGLDLPLFSEGEHTANEETVPSLATALSGAAQGPRMELGFSPPRLPHPRHRSSPPFTPLEGERLTGQRGRFRFSPACLDGRTDGEEGHRSRVCRRKRCCTEHYCYIQGIFHETRRWGEALFNTTLR